MSSSINIVDLDPRLNKQLAEDFPSQSNGFVQVGPSKYLLPVRYREEASDFLNFKLRPDDVWLLTFARSGTTVIQELVWLLTNDLDYKHAQTESFKIRSRFLEMGTQFSEHYKRKMLEDVGGDKEKEEIVERFCGSRVPLINEVESPRVIKSHFPLSLLPPDLLDTCKVVYVARNPRDVATSYYHFSQENLLLNYQGDFPKFWNHFQHGHVLYGPHYQHIAEAWKYKNHPNMHFQFYENLITDKKGTIESMAAHLGKKVNQEQVEKMQEHLSMENFRKNQSIDPNASKAANWLPDIIGKNFLRKGKNNDWREFFTPEMKIDSDRWIAENYNVLPDFEFPKV